MIYLFVDQVLKDNYHLLEQKCKQKASFSNEIDFLKSSDIVIKIDNNILKHSNRIIELCSRAHQLNYTKKEITYNNLKMYSKINLYNSSRSGLKYLILPSEQA